MSKKLLPDTANGKVTAVFGYIVAAIGLLFSVLYFRTLGSPCVPDYRTQMVHASLLFGFGQLAACAMTVMLVQGLRRHHSLPYRLLAITSISIILVAQLYLAVGFGFGVGTGCTT